ncbi:MAG: hypothetical protein Q9N34_05810 [Aquificota bacterium]|nr:hypothetical protein [Aquificota bacterium]
MVEFDARRVDLKEVHRLRDMGVKVLITGIDSGRYYNRFRILRGLFPGGLHR